MKQEMEIEILGTGTSIGIPRIMCDCEVCRSTDPHDKRLRASAIISSNGHNILIDCGPDFRQQILRSEIGMVDSLLMTHIHYDHAGGIDDLRPFCKQHPSGFPIFGQQSVLDIIHRNLPYCFPEEFYPGAPRLSLNAIEPYKAFKIGDLEIMPLLVMHGKLPILGYRINDFAYITDASSIPDETLRKLQGLEVLVLNSLRIETHPTHFSLSESLAIVERLKPRRTYFTHMADQMGKHADINAILPNGVELAYDGLVIKI